MLKQGCAGRLYLSCGWSKFINCCNCIDDPSWIIPLLSAGEKEDFLLLIDKMGLFQSGVMADGKGIMVKMSFCYCA